MKIIEKFLVSNGVIFEFRESHRGRTIVIELEKKCCWINGYGEEMKYAKVITIFQDRYRKYILKEVTGYSNEKEHIRTGRQKELVSLLENLI